MVSASLTLPTFLLTAALCAAKSTSNDVNITSLNEDVKKMDAVLQELQSHSQAQEQKYSAVLSSVLSQLTVTSEELSASKNITEELKLELSSNKNVTEMLLMKVENLEEDLRNLKETNNKTLLDYTVKFDMLEQSHNESLLELETVKSEVISLQRDLQNCSAGLTKLHTSGYSGYGLTQLNPTQMEALVSLAEIAGEMNATGKSQLDGSKWPWLQKDIGFQAALMNSKRSSPSGRIVFDKVIHSKGNGYNTKTGYFTAPVSGTYLFWTNIVYRSDQTAITFRIQTAGAILGIAYGRANESFGTARTTTIFYLKKGERTWITSSRSVTVQGVYSSTGAVLIKQY